MTPRATQQTTQATKCQKKDKKQIKTILDCLKKLATVTPEKTLRRFILILGQGKMLRDKRVQEANHYSINLVATGTTEKRFTQMFMDLIS